MPSERKLIVLYFSIAFLVSKKQPLIDNKQQLCCSAVKPTDVISVPKATIQINRSLIFLFKTRGLCETFLSASVK